MIPSSTNSQAGDNSGPSAGHDLSVVVDVHRPVPPPVVRTHPPPRSYPASALTRPSVV